MHKQTERDVFTCRPFRTTTTTTTHHAVCLLDLFGCYAACSCCCSWMSSMSDELIRTVPFPRIPFDNTHHWRHHKKRHRYGILKKQQQKQKQHHSFALEWSQRPPWSLEREWLPSRRKVEGIELPKRNFRRLINPCLRLYPNGQEEAGRSADECTTARAVAATTRRTSTAKGSDNGMPTDAATKLTKLKKEPMWGPWEPGM
jgi:hypothetical protein